MEKDGNMTGVKKMNRQKHKKCTSVWKMFYFVPSTFNFTADLYLLTSFVLLKLLFACYQVSLTSPLGKTQLEKTGQAVFSYVRAVPRPPLTPFSTEIQVHIQRPSQFQISFHSKLNREEDGVTQKHTDSAGFFKD